MAKVYIVEEGVEAVYELFDDDPEITIGRGASNDVQIRDGHSTKLHVALRRVHGRWKMVDMESKNGTRVNGHFLNQRWLEHGDSLTIGAAVLRYDAEGVLSGPPSARPVPPVPVARTAPAVAAVAGAARAVPPTALGASRPRPPSPAAPPPRPSAAPAVSRRRREEAYDDDDGEGQRPSRRRSSNSATMLLLGIIGVGAFVVVIFALGSGGISHNMEVRRAAQELKNQTKFAEAIAYIEANGHPGEKEYGGVAEELATLRSIIAGQAADKHQAAAVEWLDKQVMRHTVTPGFAAKDRLPDSEIATRLRQFLTEFGGTYEARRLLNANEPNMEALRQMLRANIDPTATASGALKQADLQVESLIAQKRWGDAVGTLEGMRNYQRLFLTPEQYQELLKMLDPKVIDLKSRASIAFNSELTSAQTAAAAGRVGEARRRIEALKTSFAIPELMQLADLALSKIR